VKIDTTRLEPVATQPITDAAGKASKSGKTVGAGQTEDSVGLSPIGALAAKIDNLSEERLQELRRQVADGTYHVDAQKISEKLVQSMFEK
jgi:anti-sigma28 factor (negative regulator of flagellin synthesis)